MAPVKRPGKKMPGRPRRSVSSLPSSAATRDQLTTRRLSTSAGRPARATAPRARPPRWRPRRRRAGGRCPASAARRLRDRSTACRHRSLISASPASRSVRACASAGPANRTRTRAPNARARSDCGVSSATRRVFSSATRSARRSTSSRLWVEIEHRAPLVPQPQDQLRTSRALSGSSPEVGSSSSTAPGSWRSARASATRWRSPFESTAAARRRDRSRRRDPSPRPPRDRAAATRAAGRGLSGSGAP